MEKETEKRYVTPMDVAKVLGVEEKFLEVLTEQELRKNHIENELKKTEEDFLSGEFVDLPK